MEKLALFGGKPVLTDSQSRYVWPPITKRTEEVVLEQLYAGISIKDRSGVIEDLENKFSSYYNVKYSVLHNSGTMAIFAMFDALGLSPGDEVICPNYTWFATVSPLIYLGVKPIFCDVDENGNLDPLHLIEVITEMTKAVIVVHLWGMPCDMKPIVNICREHGVHLLEDCSHAHGAEYEGNKVGTFGTASAWSLQGSKILSAGEGGVLLTNDEDVYVSALLTGHYNRRCKSEIPVNHDLRKYCQTGFGLKLRIHPLGAAIANEQMDHLDGYLKQKRFYAKKMSREWIDYPFLKVPKETNCLSSWYYFMLRFDETLAGVSRKRFHEALLAEGLVEADIPGLTGPISNLPLFKEISKVRPSQFSGDCSSVSTSTPKANELHKQVIMFPVWADPKDTDTVDAYIAGVCKVADAIYSKQFSKESYENGK